MSFRLRSAGSLVVALVLSASALVGCKSNTAAKDDRLPPEVYAAMNRGDELITEGEALVEEGKKKGDAGADTVKQGEARIAEGQKMKSEAAATLKQKEK